VIVDFACPRLVAAGIISDLDVSDAISQAAEGCRQLAVHPGLVIDVILQEKIVGPHLLDDRHGLIRARQPKARDVLVVDRFDQQLDIHFLQHGCRIAQILHDRMAHDVGGIIRTRNANQAVHVVAGESGGILHRTRNPFPELVLAVRLNGNTSVAAIPVARRQVMQHLRKPVGFEGAH